MGLHRGNLWPCGYDLFPALTQKVRSPRFRILYQGENGRDTMADITGQGFLSTGNRRARATIR